MKFSLHDSHWNPPLHDVPVAAIPFVQKHEGLAVHSVLHRMGQHIPLESALYRVMKEQPFAGAEHLATGQVVASGPVN